MIELLDDLEAWRRQGVRAAAARVIRVDGSGPRLPGAAMAVSEHGEVVGSVSGGCVEGAVVSEALEILGGTRRHQVSFGYSDDDAFAVGLTCGGTVHLYIEPYEDPELFAALRAAVAASDPVALATVVEGPGTGAKLLVGAPGADAGPGDPGPVLAGSLGNADLDRVVARDAAAELAAGRTGIRHYGARGEARIDAVLSVFVESFAPPPHMVIIGAVDFTAALVRVARLLSYRVTVCDARATFATTKRFPDADEVVAEWPHRYLRSVAAELGPRDAVCVLSHDIKFDVPALQAALDSRAGYIGAMGSRRTHDQRLDRLRKVGVDDEGLARIHSPIGLELGARTPEETAVAIVAEIVATRYLGPGAEVRSLRDTAGPIH